MFRRIRGGRVAAAFLGVWVALTVLSACAGAPVSLASVMGGLGGGLGVTLLVLLLGSTQSGCGDENICLSPPLIIDGGRNAPFDGGVRDTGVDDADAGVEDVAYGLPRLDEERYAVVAKLRQRGVDVSEDA